MQIVKKHSYSDQRDEKLGEVIIDVSLPNKENRNAAEIECATMERLKRL